MGVAHILQLMKVLVFNLYFHKHHLCGYAKVFLRLVLQLSLVI